MLGALDVTEEEKDEVCVAASILKVVILRVQKLEWRGEERDSDDGWGNDQITRLGTDGVNQTCASPTACFR